MRDVAVAAGHRLRGHERVQDGLLDRLDGGPEERAQPGLVDGAQGALAGHGRGLVGDGEGRIAGGEGEDEVAAAVLSGAAGPGDAQGAPLCEPPALMRQERRIGGQDDDDRAGVQAADGSQVRVASGLSPGRGHDIHADLASHGHAIDGQPLSPPVVGLHQRADRPAAVGLRQHPGGRPDAALEVVAHHARAATDVALGHVGRGRRQGRDDVLRLARACRRCRSASRRTSRPPPAASRPRARPGRRPPPARPARRPPSACW